MNVQIKASFKQATVKSGNAVLQFEVLPSAEGFIDAMKMTGSVVMLTIESEQMEIPLDEEGQAVGQTNIYNNYFVTQDGELTEMEEAEIVEDAPLLPSGDGFEYEPGFEGAE